MASGAEPNHPAAAGWAALARGAWGDARATFERALAESSSAENHEGLAWAAWWSLDVDTLFEARREAYQRYLDAEDVVSAARVATWIGTDHLDFKGEAGAANGWYRRARRLLDEEETSVEYGWLAVHEASLLILHRDDTVRARGLGAVAARLGRRHEQGDLEMLGLATEGLALVNEGRIEDGMGLLDEATAIAMAAEWAYSAALPWTCCYLIYACEQIHDHERAAEWCRQATEIAERQGLHYMWGLCRAHHASVLVLQGEWSEAEQELQEATDMLRHARPHWVGEATVRLAELRRRQGRLSEAAELFRLAEGEPAALIGLGQIALDRGEPTRSRDLGEQALRAVGSSSRTERAGPLQLLVQAQAALGDREATARALAELDALAIAVGTAPLKAIAAYCGGTYSVALGDLDEARRRFEDSIGFAERARLPYEAARARLELAVVLARLGREVEAREQAARAESDLRRLGADVESVRAAGVAPPEPKLGGGRLTRREREVLSLIAEGLSNREIAAALVLSEHTVHRHVANVLAKLDCPTRAAAVARAKSAGLIGQPTV
jgi:LuxR family transcriptional regulator, maltose regulon positive regulatory protein